MEYLRVFLGLILILTPWVSNGFTDPRDVLAINSLYTALGNPPLPGWIPNGGDPCIEAWQGVECVLSNITGIVLNGANLGGVLSANLNLFTSMIQIDLSDNHIGGSIPDVLPSTMRIFSLSSNQFSGSIPNSVASLTQLTDMLMENNNLTGEIPDAFQALSSLVNLDLSGNNISGQLPSSMASLTSLTTLHLQDNQLSGVLNVLQDLPLIDLNIEHNLFSGPIPEKLLQIPNFKKDGNPFNTTVPPSLAPPAPPLSGAPRSIVAPRNQTKEPSPQQISSPGGKSFFTGKKVIGISIAGVIIFIVIAVALCFIMRCCKDKQQDDILSEKHNSALFKIPTEKPKAPEELVARPKDERRIDITRMGAIPTPKHKEKVDMNRTGVPSLQKENRIDVNGLDSVMPPVEKLIVNPIVPAKITTGKPPAKSPNLPSSVRYFTVASLQQYTNSFTQENRIGGGMLGSVYRAELPDGKVLAVKKLDNMACVLQNDKEFLDLVLSISKLQHVNVVKLEGYCADHGQRLLIFEYCSNGTLHDALHSDGLTDKLTWNMRVRMALGAARALEYLHEVCHPPVVHRNFKSANVLLDDDFAVRVSDCGLAPFVSESYASQQSGQPLSANGYGAPEVEMGTYSYQSDVYSFGVVMLELLTGRKAYDRSRPWGEQFLVRWAIPQLHDIDALSRMVDPSLNGAYPAKSLSRFADIISLCIQSEPEFRPPMSEIVQKLLNMIQREPPVSR